MADRHRQRARLAQVGAQGPPTRRSARLATAAARARGSLLCTTWTKPQPNLRATKPNPVQFLMSKRVQFRMSVDKADDAVTRGISSSLQQSVSVIPSAWGKTAQFVRHDLA
jgi:hypothetical protein